jgi:hypothetical protein
MDRIDAEHCERVSRDCELRADGQRDNADTEMVMALLRTPPAKAWRLGSADVL